MLVSGVLLSQPGYAFDASQILKEDSKSTEVFQFFFEFRNDGKKEEAIEVLRYAAENGNSAAQWKLARIYQTGDGVQQDQLAAFNMFKRIAAQYSNARPNSPNWQFAADAFVELGDYHIKGINNSSIRPDETAARIMYTTAAMVFRHPDAQFKLGRMQIRSDKGFGQARQGIRNLGLAYEKGHIGAEALLGFAIFEGEHIKRDRVRGLVMLGNALRRSQTIDQEWIRQLHDEAFSLAHPEERTEAYLQLSETTSSLQ